MRGSRLLALGFLALTCACAPDKADSKGGSGAAGSGRLVVYAGVEPYAVLARKIGGERAEAVAFVPLSQGADGHTFDPTPRMVATLSEADLYFETGLEFEAALAPKIAEMRDGPRVVGVTKNLGIPEQPLRDGEEPREMDPHFWLDPQLAEQIVQNMAKAMAEADPAGEAVYADNAGRLIRQLDEIHLQISKTLEPYKGRVFYVYHPAFGHFANRYGLVQKSVNFEGKMPSAMRLSQLTASASRDLVETVFVQPQFSRAEMDVFAREIGGKTEILDPMPANYPEGLADLANTLAEAFRNSASREGFRVR